jgi:hypothetical protein
LGKGNSIKPKPEPTTARANALDNQLEPVHEAKAKAELLSNKPSNSHSFLVAGTIQRSQSI